MNKTSQIALIYGASLAGAGVISLVRGRRGKDVVVDTLLHGLLLGTGLSVVAWVWTSRGYVPVVAKTNPLFGPKIKGMGSIPKAAISLLEGLDTATLYKDMDQDGVSIGPVGDDPSIIRQNRT